jgi:NitT/TauT family transport system substrate-binding protein
LAMRALVYALVVAVSLPAFAEDKKPLEPIRLIYWKALNHALWLIAKGKGFFEQEGFDAKLQETDADARVLAKEVIGSTGGLGGSQSTHALESGQKKYFAGAICGFATHEAMARGEPIVDIGSMIMIPETLVMRKELAAALDKDLRAFKSKKMGDITYGAGEHDFKYSNVLKVELEKVGLKEKTDYSITEYPDFDKVFADLLAKKIDVAKGFPPTDVDFVKAHPEFVRVPFAKFFPYLPCCRQVVTRSQLKQNREKYVRLLRASIRAHEFTVEHPQEAAELLSRELKTPPEVIRQAVMSAYVSLTPDPMKKGVELYQRTNDRYTGTHTATAEYVDTSLYRDALLSLAAEAQSDPKRKPYFDTMIGQFKQND